MDKKILKSYQVSQSLSNPPCFNGSKVSLLKGRLRFPLFASSHPLIKPAGKVILQAIKAK